MLYPYEFEEVTKLGLTADSMIAMLVLVLMVGFVGWGMFGRGGSDGAANVNSPELEVVSDGQRLDNLSSGNPFGSEEASATPTQPYIILVTPTAYTAPWQISQTEIAQLQNTATPEPAQSSQSSLPDGYARVLVVGRFSNYWPPNGGINAQGDAELFADGSRVDQAIAEHEKVVACPVELLLGTRIEFPPGSGVVWTCRDRGEAITFYYAESGLPIYWFDFLNERPFVDYGSYIQVEIFVPCGQTECQ